ncbi:unnamed protein product [Camellia sinensis]
MKDYAWMEDSGCSFVCFMDREKVPLSHHTWMEDSASSGQPSTCCEPEFLCEVQRKFDQRNSL